MNNIWILGVLAIAGTGFAEEKSSVDRVSMISSEMTLSLDCNWEPKRKGKGQYHCWKSDIDEAAQLHALKNKGEYIGYRITSAPVSFYSGQWERETHLRLEVRYLK